MREEPAPRRRRRDFVITAVLVVVLGGVSVPVVLGRHGAGSGGVHARHDQRGRQQPATSSPAPVPPLATPHVPQVNLAGLRWVDFHGIELPVSPPAGPRIMHGGLASGFADTPLGALLAALNIAVRANAQFGPGIFGPTITNQVTGPDAGALLENCQAAYNRARQAAHVAAGQPLGNAYVVEEAYRWVAYSPADATVDIVSARPGSQGLTVRAATRIEVTWSGTDWRVIAPPGGDWGNAAEPLSSLAGFTSFPVPSA